MSHITVKKYLTYSYKLQDFNDSYKYFFTYHISGIPDLDS